MLGVTHVAVGMMCQNRLRKPWVYVPVAFATHGILDASAVYHDFSVLWTAALLAPAIALAWSAWKRGMWLGALAAVLPDIDWVVKGLIGIAPHPITKWNIHHWIEQYPRWNWHGLYGQLWGIPLEVGLVVLCLAVVFGPEIARRLRRKPDLSPSMERPPKWSQKTA